METHNIHCRKEWLAARKKNINSSEVAALFDLSPYSTYFETFHSKLSPSEIAPDESNEPQKWGLRLQESIARGVAEDNGFNVEPFPEYMVISELRMGSSFDFKIGAEGILEVKNVGAYRFHEWAKNSDGTYEAPSHIELQLQHQFAVSGRKFGFIAALVGGNQVTLIKREPDSKIIDAIKERIAQFWDRIDRNDPPAPDFNRDAEFIGRMFSNATERTADMRTSELLKDAAERYRSYSKLEKTAEAGKEAAKAEILTLIGDAGKVLGSGFSISAKVVPGSRVEYERKPYRAFRLNWEKTNE